MRNHNITFAFVINNSFITNRILKKNYVSFFYGKLRREMNNKMLKNISFDIDDKIQSNICNNIYNILQNSYKS